MIEIRSDLAVVLTLVFTLLIFLFFRLVVSQFERRLGERFAARDKQLALETKAFQELRQEVSSMRRTLPIEYVRREDWVRFSTVTDAKLDRILEIVRQSVPGGAKP